MRANLKKYSADLSRLAENQTDDNDSEVSSKEFKNLRKKYEHGSDDEEQKMVF